MARVYANAPDLVVTASEDDRLETLKALRHELAVSIKRTEAVRDVASLSNAMMKCLTEIAELEGDSRAKPDTSKMTTLEKVMAEGRKSKAG